VRIYHITHAPADKSVYLHFWGCKLGCRACLLKKEIYDCHLIETKDRIFKRQSTFSQIPQSFLALKEVMQILEKLDVRQVVFMGAEPALDPHLPQLAENLHREFASYNVLLTNGFNLIDLRHIDEMVFSLKARTNALHRHYTGKSNEKALENFIKFYQTSIKLRAESVFVPEYIDCAEIEKIAKFIAGVDKSIPYRIDAYIPIGDNPWRRPTPQEMEKAVSIARKYLLNVSRLTGNEDLKYEVVRIY
jgi:pyruvate formate lyase activating enzyme